MSIKLSLALILIAFSIILTSLFNTNQTARGFIAIYAHKIGINIGNYVTNTPVCPVHWQCVSPTP